MLETPAAINLYHLGRLDSIHKNGDSGDGVFLGLNQLNIVKMLNNFSFLRGISCLMGMNIGDTWVFMGISLG